MRREQGESPFTPAAVMALLRVVILLAILVSERADGPIDPGDEIFGVVVAFGTVWVAALAVIAWRRPQRRPNAWEGLVDVALLGVLSYATGGPFSPARQAFFAVPVIAAACQPPRITAAWAVVAPTVFSISAVLADNGEMPGAATHILTTDIYLAAVGLAAVLTSVLLETQSADARAHGERSRHLAQQLLETRDTEGRELAHALHDHPVQLLGAARVEIGEARSGAPGALDRAAERVELAEQSLRRTAFELHPYALEELGLCEAVRRIAEEECAASGMELSLDCPALAPGPFDAQFFAIARELIGNAARHSQGRHLAVRIGGRNEATSLEVADDGVGLDEEKRRRALSQGHLGLVTVRERAALIGAELRIETGSDAGTRISIDAPRALEKTGEGLPPLTR